MEGEILSLICRGRLLSIDWRVYLIMPVPEVCKSSGGLILKGPWVRLENGMCGRVSALSMSCLEIFLNTAFFSSSFIAEAFWH